MLDTADPRCTFCDVRGFACPRHEADLIALHRTTVRLNGLGYKLTHVYGDGIFNFSRVDETCEMMVFVDSYGRAQRPRSVQTMIAHVEMLEAGIDITMPS